MLLLTALIACPVLGTAALTYLYDKQATLVARLAGGVVVGQVLAGFIGFVLALRWGLTTGTLFASALLPLLGLLVFVRPANQRLLRRDIVRLVRLSRKHSAARWLLRGAFAATLCLLVVLLRGAFTQNETGIYTQSHHNLGDLPFHLAVVQNFAVGRNYPPQHPEFAHVPLTYPFMVDFVAAQWAVCRTNLATAFFLQNALLAGSLLVLLQRYLLTLTRRPFVVAVAPLVLFLSGGWGFLMLRDDVTHSGNGLLALLSHLPHDYTIGAGAYQWGNALTTLFTTQRGLLMAFPIALMIWTLWWQAGAEGGMGSETTTRRRKLWAAGILTGGLPLVHGHTFLCVLLAAAYFAGRDLLRFRKSARWRDWVGFFVAALVLTLPQIVLLSAKSAARPDAFLAWQPGWVCEKENWVIFWFRITGPFIPLLWAAFLWRGTVSERLQRFYVPFVLCFALANLVRLAPWAWDNIKVLFVWHAASVPLVALVLARLWSQKGGAKIAARLAAAALLFCLVCAGSLDVWRILSNPTPYQEFDASGIAFAKQIEAFTPPNAVLLHAPAYNHPALLSGRRLLLGYRGHLWSHGLNYDPRWKDVQAIYRGDANADALLQKYQVWGVVVGPNETSGQEEIIANQKFFTRRYPVVAQSGAWRLYRIVPLPSASRIHENELQ